MVGRNGSGKSNFFAGTCPTPRAACRSSYESPSSHQPSGSCSLMHTHQCPVKRGRLCSMKVSPPLRRCLAHTCESELHQHPQACERPSADRVPRRVWDEPDAVDHRAQRDEVERNRRGDRRADETKAHRLWPPDCGRSDKADREGGRNRPSSQFRSALMGATHMMTR